MRFIYIKKSISNFVYSVTGNFSGKKSKNNPNKKNEPMRKIKFLFASMLICSSFLVFAQTKTEVGNLVLEDVPEIPGEIKERLRQFQNTRSASLSDWAPDGKSMLIGTRFGSTGQYHLVAQAMGVRSQITFFDEPVSGGSFCPNKKYNGFLFTKDEGGNEFSQLFWFDLDSRTSTMLSDGKSRNFYASWSNAGDKFVFTSSRRNGKDFDIYLSSMEDPKTAKPIIEIGGGYWVAGGWSTDDKKVLITQYLSITNSNFFVYDFETEELTQLNTNKGEAVNLGGGFSADNSKIVFITNQGREFNTLATYDVKSKEIEYLTKEINWDIEGVEVNEDRTKMAFTANEDGMTVLYIMDLNTMKYMPVENIPVGQVYGLNFHPTEDKLGMVINTAKSPGDVFVMDLNSKELTRWTQSEVGGLNTENFTVPKLINYETFDKVDGKARMIPAFVYLPTNKKGPFPVIINIHGGPEAQHNPYFSAYTAYLTNELGIAVVAPNVRGSSGYGSSYVRLDNGFKREDSVKDIGKLLDWIKNNEQLDENKVAVMGGSYGGYMVLSSMVNYNDRLKCGVDIVGISNFVTFLENTKEYRRDLRRVEYGDERDPEMRAFLTKISPTTNADKITKPLFVIQGANDPRVPESEASQMVEVIRNNGGNVWYMLAKDEGHGFRKKENRDYMYNAMTLFFQKYLLE